MRCQRMNKVCFVLQERNWCEMKSMRNEKEQNNEHDECTFFLKWEPCYFQFPWGHLLKGRRILNLIQTSWADDQKTKKQHLGAYSLREVPNCGRDVTFFSPWVSDGLEISWYRVLSLRKIQTPQNDRVHYIALKKKEAASQMNNDAVAAADC